MMVADSSPARRRGGFTLVELLVTLAIVGLLAGLALPALAKAKAAGRMAVCSGNLRQLGIACQLYWEDHDGAAFRYRVGRTHGGELYWFGWIASGAEGSRQFDPKLGALNPYLADSVVRICPSLNYQGARFKRKASGAAHGYGYNLKLSPPASSPPMKAESINSPAKAALFADCAQVNDFQPPASRFNPLLEEFYYFNTGEKTAHFRHAGRAAVVFADGHVSQVAMEPGSLDLRLPGERVGELPPDLVNLVAR